VTHFLMVYDRPRGELVSITPFEDSQEALRARFAEDHLRTTHGRYFGQVHDLLAQMKP
jgi:hypothetical protein